MNTLCGDRRKAKDNPSIPRSSRATDISEYRVTALTPSYQRSFGRKRRIQALSLTGMATTLPLKRASSPSTEAFRRARMGFWYMRRVNSSL